jgi:lysyl-tRNA synthetase class 2
MPDSGLARKRNYLEQRARIVQTIRAFFIDRGFLEVETPQRIPANAPEEYIDPVPSADWWLQTSPELAMKRLLAAGYGNIFQISRVWRNSERGQRHLPEFTLLEWYRPHADYTVLMDDCEQLLATLVPAGTLQRAGQPVDMVAPWPRLPLSEAFSRYADCRLSVALSAGNYEEVLTGQVEPQLGTAPLFVTDFPASMAALARLKPDDPTCAERFELYLGGLELANGFSELTDPTEQRSRFMAAEEVRRAAGKPPIALPEPFLADLQQMPPAAGIALGVDRLVMLLTGAQTIDEVVALTPEEL